jgi:site-specific DNA recombinase
MEAIGYCRVSTAEQAQDGISLAAQQAKIAAWCIAHDYEFVACYKDAGLSGSRADNRPALQNALKEVCQRKAALVVYSLSRLTRSTKDTIAISERLGKSGADLVSLSERIDTTSASGKMVFRMLAVLNEFERDQISERTKLAMAHKRASNELIGGTPYGFTLLPDGKRLISNPTEQKTLTLIGKLRRNEHCSSYRAIARELNKRGIPTKKGRPWIYTTVKGILSRPDLKMSLKK